MTARNEMLAGNIGRTTVTFTALEGHGDLSSTTAEACVTDRSGTSTSLTPTVQVAGSDVTVTVDWTTADDLAKGWYTVTVDTAGALVAAAEVRVYVQGRTEPAVP